MRPDKQVDLAWSIRSGESGPGSDGPWIRNTPAPENTVQNTTQLKALHRSKRWNHGRPSLGCWRLKNAPQTTDGSIYERVLARGVLAFNLICVRDAWRGPERWSAPKGTRSDPRI